MELGAAIKRVRVCPQVLDTKDGQASQIRWWRREAKCLPSHRGRSVADDWVGAWVFRRQILAWKEIQVQHIQFTEGPFGALYQPIFYSTLDPAAKRYLQTPKRFQDPVDLCLAGDGSRFLFVADAGVDSVYQFTSSGLEGVPPPPASAVSRSLRPDNFYDNAPTPKDSQLQPQKSAALMPPPSDPLFYEWMDMYEKLHRLNRILETKVDLLIILAGN